MGVTSSACVVFALLIAALPLACVSEVHADTPGVAPADTAKVKKERVRKETAPPARGGTVEEAAVAEDADEDFFTACIGGCIGEFIGSMLGSICGGSSSEVSAEPVAVAEVGALGGTEAQLEGEGGNVPRYFGTVAGEDSVAVWDRPGGDAAGGSMLRAMAPGTEAAAADFKYYENELWVHVQTGEPDSIDGWIRDADIVLESQPGDTAVTEAGLAPYAENPDAAVVARGRPRFHVRAEGFIPLFTDEALSEEYGQDSWGVGLTGGAILSKSIAVDARVSYIHGDGTPMYKYVGPASTDWPLGSDIDVLGMGIQIGQFIPHNEVYFAYGFGPSVFNVKESATIGEYDGETRTGTRTDELSEWRFGATVRAEAGWLAAGVVPIGVFFDFSWISWEASEEKSLTLDYLDASGIYIVSFGLRVGYLFF